MPLSGVYGSVSDEDAVATIHRALDLGINLLDTSDVYGDGHNEQLVGRAIRDRRDEVVLATKFGILRTENKGDRAFDGRPEYVKAACERSLRRLGVDHIDLYQQHRVDPDTPIEETIGAVRELIEEGKVRYIGMSEAMAPDLRRAAAVHPITSLQSEYSLMERDVEEEILDTCAELGIGFLAFSPLMRGLLGGALKADSKLEPGDARASGRFPRVGPEHVEANAALAQVVFEIASEHHASPGQVALAWLLSRRPWIVPIPGTKRTAHVQDNAGAPELELTQSDFARLEDLAAEAHGDRYGDGARLPNWVSPSVEVGQQVGDRVDDA
jgi:aryl-alcohol dehydrogenase-like predicted oxidoreductase